MGYHLPGLFVCLFFSTHIYTLILLCPSMLFICKKKNILLAFINNKRNYN